MSIRNLIAENAIDDMKKEIKKASGNEVFFRGIPSDDGIIVEVEVIARGNETSVAALINRMKKGEVIIHNHPSGFLVPSQNDIQISGVYGERGGGSYIINNDVDDLYIIVPLKKMNKIDINEYFGEKGLIKSKIEKFEIRDEQLKMSKAIEMAVNNNEKIIIEAGTGTGKTIAYLIPTLLYAIENNLRLIISTNTINLQEQLLNKDIPLLQRILNKEFRYTLVKGRGNYLCKRKLYNIDFEEFKEESDKKIIGNLQKWDDISETGDRSELKQEIPYRIWEQANCESDLCTGPKCNYYGSCYFFKARKNISESDLIIVNHHMFFADLSIRNEVGFNTEYSILPNYDVVVFDEAHNIEDTARNYFTYEISRFGFGKLVGFIHNRRITNLANAGTLTKVLHYLNVELDSADYEKIDSLKTSLIEELNSFYEKGIEIFDKMLYPFAQEIGNSEIKRRIDKDQIKNSSAWKDITKANTEFKHLYVELAKTINKFMNIIENHELEDEDGIIFDFKKYIDRLKEYYKNFEFIVNNDSEDYVYWFSVTPNKNNIKLFATPFDVSEDLKENLLSKLNKMVFTSATLAVEGKFDYFMKSMGFDKNDKQLSKHLISSPFDYMNQMRVFIPSDTIDPNSIDFIAETEVFIDKLIRKTKGHCFLLFTSYSMLNYLYNKLEKYYNKKDYTLLKQGDYSRNEMIEIFRNAKNPILFGTDSFWEGVDVQGEQLKSVIIVKLPFKVPDDPVTEAIIEHIRENKGNPFNEFQVPQAVIKFKQGIGRLIRSKSDTGIITILDNRVITKYYGRKFLNSLPKTNIIVDSKENIIEII